ncbi:GGDEF domain-containing protein [Erythrobacter sp. sf7]|uniref:GGDEF domain-containing protein n=1 Tax=Erythrobacter fulvus TaxID=2987523 RepID=A0ABT5JRF6_9SPHN|nr:GGDEF domain-containing protein [Erythrobacter fulvus]MDC8755348.1 GGDEF domain-containing protein [Erythrobacter fulvus]
MKIGLSDVEGRVLHGLLEETSGDIVLRIDQRGFILHASSNITELGFDFSSALLLPHITDLAEADHAAFLGEHVSAVLEGRTRSGWVEFPVITCAERDTCRETQCQRWHALSLRPMIDNMGNIDGALCLMRSVQQVRLLEGELHNRAVTDPLTGLANRQAFCASLRRHLAGGGGQIVGVFAVDGMRALLLRYGQRTADEVVWGFAKFLETMALPGHELAQLDGERFGVLLPEMTSRTAREWAEDVVQTFSTLATPVSAKAPQLSASAGLARVEYTVDWTMREAELGLVLARAGGGRQVAVAGHRRAA